MKVLNIALKDLLGSFRSAFALVMMFLAPLLLTGMIHLAFGSVLRGDGGFNVPVTPVQVVNLDQPDPDSGFAAGQIVVDLLQSEEMADWLQVTEVTNEASARTAVDGQETGVAVIIPPDFTSAILSPEGSSEIVVYPDPTLALGPAVVETSLKQTLDSFSGLKIAVSVVADQLHQWGIPLEEEATSQASSRYTARIQSWGESRSQGAYPALDIQHPPGKIGPAGRGAAFIGPIMAGMLIFFAFFTAANTAQSIIREDEDGTLARLFTTPTAQTAVLGGKFGAVFITVSVQAIVLLISSAILFGIRWGEPLTVVLMTLGLVIAAAGFGLLLMSFVKDTRQAGSVIGGVLTMTGMAGGLFTTGMPNMPAAFDMVTLFTPHGWALRGWKLALAGGDPSGVFLPVIVLFGMGVGFFAVGALLFRKRFA